MAVNGIESVQRDTNGRDMKRNWPQLIVVISGAVLIVVGIAAICVQMFAQFKGGGFGGIRTKTPTRVSIFFSSPQNPTYPCAATVSADSRRPKADHS